MKVFGMNRKACKGLYVVYITFNRNRYFVGAYRSEEMAQLMAKKHYGNYCYIN